MRRVDPITFEWTDHRLEGGRQAITGTPWGDTWYTASGLVGKIKPNGRFVEYDFTDNENDNHQWYGIVPGPDGDLWITQNGSPRPRIARVSRTGELTEYPTPSTSGPWGLAFGADGHLWYGDA